MLILTNGIIHTMNALQPTVEALAIQADQLIALGSTKDVLNLVDHNTTVLDLQGRTVFPGLIDAHIHLLQYGMKLAQIDCETKSKKECLQRVAMAVEKQPPGEWIIGQGWDHNIWEDGIGNRTELDAISPQNPILLFAKSLHASWVNSYALKLAGINQNTPDPHGGCIVRDPYGVSTGILLESATLLVERVIPQPDQQQMKNALFSAQQQLFQFGITSVQDVDEWKIYPVLEKLYQQNEYQLRVVKSIQLSALPEAIDQGYRTGLGNNQLKIGWLKLFMDGALGPQTAAMLEPYQGSDQYGMLTLTDEDLEEIGRQALSHKISLEIHAIGDKAIRKALDGLQKLQETFSQVSLPYAHRLEHVQIIHPDDIPRMAAMQVVASMQPIHLISDMNTADRYWGKRCEFAYAWNTIRKAGIPLIFGSDAPVESPNPFLGIHAAVTRCRKGSPSAWHPEQALPLEAALAAYSINPASIIQQPQNSGMLAKGYLADLVILSEDPTVVPPDQLDHLTPLATMVGGKFVWQHSDFFPDEPTL